MRVARWVLAVGAWVICAAALSLFAFNGTAAARSALLKATRPAPGPSVPASPSPSPGSPVVLRTAGGSVVAGCDGGKVTVQYLRPATGFRILNADRAPGAQSHVTFKSDKHEVRVVVHCAADGPQADVTVG